MLGRVFRQALRARPSVNVGGAWPLALILRVVAAGTCLCRPAPVAAQPDARAAALVERTAPTLLGAPTPPAYPSSADGSSARFVIVLTVSREGNVVEARVEAVDPADAPDVLTEAALAHARALRFSPATRDGAVVVARIRYELTLEPELFDVTEPTSASDTVAVSTPPPAAAAESAEAAPEASVAAVDHASVAGDDASEHEPTYSASGSADRSQPEPAVSASDMTIRIGALRGVPRGRPADFLRLAPGVLLTNEGGDGHADRIYLRGFDAREGQDLEITVQGVPVNEPGNPHGEGYADLNFVMPELIQAVRVVEGPFDPSQGNYTVAGSVQYELGLARREIGIGYQGGSFNTHRFTLLYGPEGFGQGTFVGADLRTTDGYGTNRAAQHARAIGQVEVPLSNTLILRVLGTAYATRFGSAGVIRQDDFAAHRIDFFGSYDPTQGGDASRYSVAVSLDDVQSTTEFRNMLWFTSREFLLRSNFTGFLEDPPAQYRSGIAQRGDETSQAEGTIEVGLRGRYRQTVDVLGSPWRFEVGYYGRHDIVGSSQRRLRFGTTIPYRVDFDYQHQISNLGLYVSADLRVFSFLSLRGGVRGDYFHYETLDQCALHDTVLLASEPILDVLCYARDRTGPRDPTSRRSSSGAVVQPRGTLIVGPLEGLSFVGSIGSGARAADPSYLSDGDRAPFVSIMAYEGGLVFSREIEGVAIDARGAVFYTEVGRDLIFNQQVGRYTLAPGTERLGALLAARVTTPWLDAAVSGTWAQARFRRDVMDPGSTYFPPDTGNRVPFVPTWVLRADVAVHGALDFVSIDGTSLYGNIGIGASYVSGRALLYGQTGQDIAVVDLGCAVGWRAVEVGLNITNLFDSRYHQSELNYASSFTNTNTPDLIPTRTFVAGPPLTLMVTLALRYDASEWRAQTSAQTGAQTSPQGSTP